jgi:hypothetical protein
LERAVKFIAILLLLCAQAAADRICPPCDGVGCVQCGFDGRIDDPLAPETIDWIPYAEALKTGKPLMIHVTDSGDCPWCVKADAAFANPVVVAASQNFACVLVDRATAPADAYRKFAAYYQLTVAPTTLFLYPDLTWLGRKTGYTADYPNILAIATERAARHVRGVPIVVEAKAQPQPLMPRLRLPRSILAPRATQSRCGPNGCF